MARRIQIEQQRFLFQQIPCCLDAQISTPWAGEIHRQTLPTGIRQVAEKYNAEIMAIEIMPDHVQLLCAVDPQFGIHRLVKNSKGVSSHTLRKEFSTLRSRIPTLWTNGYLVSTVAGAPLAVIRPYVEKQKNA